MLDRYASRNKREPHKISAGDPLAIALLKEEHHAFRSLFDEAEDANPERLVQVAREICMRLTVHMAIEEELLYPALRPVLGEDEVNEGIVEHQSGKRIVAELEQLNGDEPLFAAKVHVLGEETIHHIDEEDEDMFAVAREAHDKGEIDLNALGETLRARQAELYDQIISTGETGRTDEAQPDEVARS
ncbi:hemerythrin domain-containing protein [Rhizorhabdus sp. FW153]|uniref:hemerythrin domain-containing protein n=1 Tax=Rhizorhabdus sp. FW153 TaxID=3400216 RepID=UPI003CFA3866